jgi:hypothetical protein
MLIVTTLSLVAAAVSGVFAWRVWRQEQLRSAARISALEAAIDGENDAVADFEWEEPLTPDPAPPVTFSTVSRQSSRPSIPVLTAAISLVAGVILVVLMAMLADRDNPPLSVADVTTQESLELLSMSHARDGSSLVVTGIIRNASRAETSPLTTVVTALDRDGQIVASATTPLATLPPGKTRPFRVRIDNAGSVGRYRVSFKSEAGIVPHMDRRGTRAAARAAAE